jgi:hypothetical protein
VGVVEDSRLEDNWPLVIRAVLRRLRRRADRKVVLALAIAIDLRRGHAPAEIRKRHQLTEEEYEDASRWAHEELNMMRGDEDAQTTPGLDLLESEARAELDALRRRAEQGEDVAAEIGDNEVVLELIALGRTDQPEDDG